MARGFGAYDNIIVGADDARLLIFSGTLDLLWVARAAQGDRFQAVVISTIEVDVSVVSASVLASGNVQVFQVPKTAGGTRGIVVAHPVF